MMEEKSNNTFANGAGPELRKCDSDTFQCPVCHKKGSYPKLVAHLQGHRRSIVEYGGYSVYKCQLGCVQSHHYHCGFCTKVIVRKEFFVRHFKICCKTKTTNTTANLAFTVTPASTPAPMVTPVSTVTPAATVTPASTPAAMVIPVSTVTMAAPAADHRKKTWLVARKKTTCCFCCKPILRKNLKTHIERQHKEKSSDITANHHLNSVCVDGKRGIFAVSRSFKATAHYIHAQKCTWGSHHHVSCQLETCNRAYDNALPSGLLEFDCVHVRSLAFSPVTTTPAVSLDDGVLTDMLENKWLSQNCVAECLTRKLAADDQGAPLSVVVNLENEQGHIYLSVFEPHISLYSRYGRVMVHYDNSDNSLSCPCSEPWTSCPHKAISKWHLHQLRPDFFVQNMDCQEESSDAPMEDDATPVEDYAPMEDYAPVEDDAQPEHGLLYPPEGKALVEMVDYLISHKALPANLPRNLISSEDMPRHLVPKENFCHKCPGKVPLSGAIAICKNAKIVSVTGIVEGITTYFKLCVTCNTFYRYQEWTDGLHNFNDGVILTHHFCLFLRNSVQNHTAVASAVAALQATNKDKYPDHDSILHGYLHFEALSAHEYSFSCASCGNHPPVVIMDLHKKGVLSVPMSDLKEPPSDFNGEVDMEDFWHSVSQEIICRGFVKSNAANPCGVSPSYHKWAPWIGPHTRASNMVFNKEYKKVKGSKGSNPLKQAEVDRLTTEVMDLKVDLLRTLVKQCGLDSSGSKMDLVIRLREQMKDRSTYDKVFQKVWGASGGWAVIMCPCGVVSSVKFNIRAESPQDYADMLLSFKHLPNVVMASPQILDSAKKGEMEKKLPWVNLRKRPADINAHPDTGSADHYALYDTFHEANMKDLKDCLRKVGLVPEICGWVNSQTAEQLFSKMRKNNHFLSMMSPGSHVFLMRCMIHHHNLTINEKTLTDLQEISTEDIATDRAGLGPENSPGILGFGGTP
ncbi:uncharacterized protein LOC131471639 [Solea solea]|uniref:uncharacterized protein LOC131471639 n=1 Tax=Solea solea TaxID=90069 RepID=UPI00272CCD9A|nr:uncharacterized protein LOC131471639 [Solea solea]XP_058504285.1 uncharacterized protein LOC131471639 [Solea solea]XP_058504294.1 uncharacterized protein LOC131471639 [Solea solea]